MHYIDCCICSDAILARHENLSTWSDVTAVYVWFPAKTADVNA